MTPTEQPVQAPKKRRAKAKPKPEHTLRWPTGMTLAPRVTTCARCTGRPAVLAAVIHGIDRHIDPLPLSAPGLVAALTTGRVLFVANPAGPPMVERATPGHWWIRGYHPTHRPSLLAEHVHHTAPLEYDPALAGVLLARLAPPPAWTPGADTEPPF